jgi:methionyl-tRNA formyltransferase
VVFVGASHLGHRCCEALLRDGVHVAGIVTMPATFRISYAGDREVENVQHVDFGTLACAHDVPVITCDGRLGAQIDAVRAWAPDLLVVVGWYHMIPASVRALARAGCVGVHASLLPKNRGGAPLVWAMIDGDTETGVTLFHFSDGVDDGDIVSQRRFAIGATDTIADVLPRAAAASVALVREFVPQLLEGTAPRTPQDHTHATVRPQRSPDDGAIDWRWDRAQIERFVRAQGSPYPGAFAEVFGSRIPLPTVEALHAFEHAIEHAIAHAIEHATERVLEQRPQPLLGVESAP